MQVAQQDFFSKKIEYRRARDIVEFTTSDLLMALNTFFEKQFSAPHLASETLRLQNFVGPEKNQFETSFQLIQGKIQRGEIEKAVPMVAWSTSRAPGLLNQFLWFRSLLRAPTNLFPSGVWQDEQGYMGATPEKLFHLRDGRIYSMALAGTSVDRSDSAREQLLDDPKELREHQLVVEDLKLALSGFGRVQCTPLSTLAMPQFFHLFTEIQVDPTYSIEKLDLELLIQKLHPTPALGVAPRAYGFQWMSELPEQKNRKNFGAPVCFKISEQETLGLVNIRSIFWSAKEGTKEGSKETKIFTGCGLVSDSQIDKEWSELHRKANMIFALLEME